MDEQLERPGQLPGGDDGDSSDGGEGLDWSKISTSNRPVIPKRGEKDFEPRRSGLQEFTLEKSRNAMLNALQTTRGASSKAMSHAIWHPVLGRAEVIQPRGIHFATMGHSALRPGSKRKRLELLPEETLYLIERGSMFCWKNERDNEDTKIENVAGTPMTVQQAFAEMIGKEDLDLEKYQVYAYLKRLGYTVARAKAPSSSPFYPTVSHTSPKPASPIIRLIRSIQRFLSYIRSTVYSQVNWWRLCSNLTSYSSIFRSLRFIPSGHKNPLNLPPPAPDSPYKVFFNIWKPNTNWRRSPVPPPDFEIIVINGEKTPLPTLSEITAVFEKTLRPRIPPQPSRPQQAVPRIRRLFSYFFRHDKPPPPKINNAFNVLKMGTMTVIIAVVDCGMISFLRFGQGCFEDWPMI